MTVEKMEAITMGPDGKMSASHVAEGIWCMGFVHADMRYAELLKDHVPSGGSTTVFEPKHTEKQCIKLGGVWFMWDVPGQSLCKFSGCSGVLKVKFDPPIMGMTYSGIRDVLVDKPDEVIVIDNIIWKKP